MLLRWFAFALAVLLPTVTAQGGDAKTDLKKLQGKWEVIEIVSNDAPVKNEGIKAAFAGDKMTLLYPGANGTSSYSIKLDPAKTPSSIDATALDGLDKGAVSLGIYVLSGDTFKLCLTNRASKERPTAFKAAKGSDLVLMTFKRTKP